MQHSRSVLSSSIFRSRQRSVLSSSFAQSTPIRLFGKLSRNVKPRTPVLERTRNIGKCWSSVVGGTRIRDARLIGVVAPSHSRHLSTKNDENMRHTRDFDDEIEEEAESILLLLKDKKSHPIGSMSSEMIWKAENALEYYVSTSTAIVRQQKRRRHNSHDRQDDEHRKLFENAKTILSRLVLEQKCHDDHNYITESDISYARAGTEMVNSGSLDDGSVGVKNMSEENGNLDDKIYFVRTFLLNRVVDCWRIGWRDRRLDFTPNEMIEWVEEMDSSRSDSNISDNRTYTMVVDGVCLRGNPSEAPLLAQWLLDRRLGKAQEDEDDTTLRPDTIFFTNVIRSWAKSGRVEAPEMADGLLQMMIELYSNSGWIESAPNAMTYAATMEAWSKTHHNPDSIKRIEALLEEMKNSNLIQVVPDRVSYQYALNAWANSKTATGAKKSYDLLQEMIALYEAGNILVAPNASNFSRVLLALAQQGDAKRVDSVLGQLQALYSTTGDPNFQPTDKFWKACIIAKAKIGRVAEAQGMLDEFVERASSNGNSYLMPSRSHFVDTLVAWTKVKDQVIAAEKSQKVLDRMIELAEQDITHRNLRPNAKTYERVILAWSRSRHSSAPDRIESLLHDMRRQCNMGDYRMKPSLVVYTNLMLAWERSGRKESADAIQKIFDWLQIQYTENDEKHLRPDRFVFGILIDSWARRRDFQKIESVFEEMVKEWKNGNNDARPDVWIFHKILRAYSKGKQNSCNAVKKCEYYFSYMKELGIPTTIQSYSYLISALSPKSGAGETNINRASEVLDELLESTHKGKTTFPIKHWEYRQFLQIVSNSSIPHRNRQAKKVLMSLNRDGGPVPKDLLPP